MVSIKSFFNKHPIILTFILIGLGFWFIWWLSQPVEIIYKENGPLYWWYDHSYH